MPAVTRQDFRFPWPGRVNPALAEVEDRHVDWMLERKLLTADQAGAYRQLRYTELMARYLPDADPEDLLVVADLTGIGFLMDDVTEDSGTVERITKVFGEFMHVMSDPDHAPSNPVMVAWKDVWTRLIHPMSPQWRERARRNWQSCFDAFLQERRVRDEGRPARLPEYTYIHRISVGAYVYSDFLERAYHFELDPFIEATPSIQMLRWTVAEHIYQVNDLLSLEKDEKTGDDNNLIRLLQRTRGCRREAAIQLVLAACNRQVEYFQTARLILENTVEYRTAEESSRNDVDRFVDGLFNWMVGALDWSFATSRYRAFDDEAQEPTGDHFSAASMRSLQ